MKAWEIRGSFGLENLRQVERETPKPGPGQVLLRVKATSLNFRDLMMVSGTYNPRQKLPLVPFSDGAGEVAEVGEGVAAVKPGDRVCSTFSQNWPGGKPTRERLRASMGGPRDGCLAQYVLLEEHGVIPIPEHLSFEEAATLPCAGVTAWAALAGRRKLTAGQSVLLQGTGGVSIFALQFAKALGATTIVTSSSDEKLERTKELGSDHRINYKETPDWHKPARELTGGVGVDHIVEVGGAGTLERSLKSVKIGGFIAVIGVLAGPAAPLNVTQILMNSVHVQGITVGSRDDFEAMNACIRAHKIHPVVDRSFGFDEAVEALKFLQAGKHFGKIVVNID